MRVVRITPQTLVAHTADHSQAQTDALNALSDLRADMATPWTDNLRELLEVREVLDSMIDGAEDILCAEYDG